MKKSKGKSPKVAITTKDDRFGTAKKATPVKVTKKKGSTRPPRVAAAAPVPNQGLNSPREFHDPESDLHTLTRAQEIRSDGRRHSAAVATGKQKLGQLSRVVKGMKVTTSDA
jgi:hypothetical protein